MRITYSRHMKLFSPSLLVLSAVLNILAVLLLIPGLLGAALKTGNESAFYLSAGLASATGVVLGAMGYKYRAANLQPRQMFIITATAWLVVPFFGALPFWFWEHGVSFTDAVFEAVSGLTTTGSTIFVGLDSTPSDILLWRSMLHWVGGMGIIGMAIAVMPFLSVGGMKLFRTESSDWSDKSLPRTQQFLLLMVLTYSLLTLACFLAYSLFGMDIFNAINHAMATVSTGGFSTSDSSFAQFDSLPLHWVSIVFMILGGTPFVLFIRLVRHRQTAIFRDAQWRGMLVMLTVLALLLTLPALSMPGETLSWAITHATFNIVSVVTTTGFASADYTLWGDFSIAIFFFATFLGGCSGSTSGGIKTFRVQLCFAIIREQIIKAVHPNAILKRQYNGSTVSDEIVASLVGFLFLMAISLTIMTLLLSLMGLDLVTSLTGSATALMNVGPGLGAIVGPAGNFQPLPDSAKWVLSMGMILGRLEFLTIIVLLTPAFWRR
ncbi:MAG: TrkH family potassium uptake protein [Gammaproteobacteria bacterium]|nr:TrkH family potassium uptake protein [Gammaproteobacteria bacterium]